MIFVAELQRVPIYRYIIIFVVQLQGVPKYRHRDFCRTVWARNTVSYSMGQKYSVVQYGTEIQCRTVWDRNTVSY